MRGIFRWAATAIGGLLVIGAFGCQASGTGGDAEGAAQQPQATPQRLSIGDSVEMSGLAVMLNSARLIKDDVANGSITYQVPPGEDWLILDISVTNNRTEPVTISSLAMFKLVDEEPYSRNQTITTLAKGSVDGPLAPGSTMRGQIAYSVDEDQQAWELVFQPELLSTEQAVFTVTAE